LSFAQTSSYSDSSFQIGQTKTIDYYQFYTHPIHDKLNVKILDSLADFLKENNSLKIKIINHTQQRGTDKYNLKLSYHRAEMLRIQLQKRKIDTSRIQVEGLGEIEPIITEVEILKMKTEEEREEAYAKNERTVILIIEK
jgi:peptidoglycan-associated lipoprotein